MLFAFIDVYLCPSRFLYQMMLLSFNSNNRAFISGTGTVYLSEHLSLPCIFVEFVLLNR